MKKYYRLILTQEEAIENIIWLLIVISKILLSLTIAPALKVITVGSLANL